MQQWQHAWIFVDLTKREDTTKLDEMGDEGWELVSAFLWGQPILMMLFKRPRAAPA